MNIFLLISYTKVLVKEETCGFMNLAFKPRV